MPRTNLEVAAALHELADLHEALGVGSLEELEEALKAGRLRDLKGFGAKSEENLLRALASHSREERRILLGEALGVAKEMLEGLRTIAGVERASYAGSLRRMRDTIGDLDLLAATFRPGEGVEAFGGLPNVGRVSAKGPTKASVLTRGALPSLVTVRDLRGDLQSHSVYSDGRRTVREMALAAAEKGYEYFAITDHGRNLSVVRNLSLEDIERQRAEVRALNEELAGRIVVLHGLEANIGMEGELDYPDEGLAGFDVVVASLHHQLRGGREAITRRVVRAIEHPAAPILGRPPG